jgi:hypothetical protein
VHLKAAYQDKEALQQLADTCAAVTTEFENVPADSLRWLAAHCTVRPTGDSVAIAQDRSREKKFLRDHGFGTAAFALIESEADLTRCDAALYPGILKRARFGYDGKGQARVANAAEARAAFVAMGAESCVLEELVTLACEVSVVVARGADGATQCFPVAENQHTHSILDVCIVPARVAPELARQAERAAADIGQNPVRRGNPAQQPFRRKPGFLGSRQHMDRHARHAPLQIGHEIPAIMGITHRRRRQHLERLRPHGARHRVIAMQHGQRLAHAVFIQKAGFLQPLPESQDRLLVENDRRIAAVPFIDNQTHGIGAKIDHAASWLTGRR